MNKFVLIEGKTYPCYVNPEYVTCVDIQIGETTIHLVSGEVIKTKLSVQQVLSLLSHS